MVKTQLEDIAVAADGSYYLMLLSTEEGELLPITIDGLQAQSILLGQSDESFDRPLTHDLLLSILELLGAELKRIEITDLNEGVYFAQLILESRGIEYEIDARPSDAISLAVRTKADLFVAKDVLDQAAMTEDDFGGPGSVEA